MNMAAIVVWLAVFHFRKGIGADVVLDAFTNAPAIQLEVGVCLLVGVPRENVQLFICITTLHIHQHGRSGQNAGTGAHIDVAARINPAKAAIIDIRVPVAFGSRVREFSLYAQHGPANGDVRSEEHTSEQTIDRSEEHTSELPSQKSN